jgi:predicted glycoside hydrolase/deacetylase ChbG (UPF0249 family)
MVQDGYVSQFVEDPFEYDQTLAEARAQVRRFISLMGRTPAYIHHHSLVSEVSDHVLHEIAREYDLLPVGDLLQSGKVPWVPNTWYESPFPLERQKAINPMEYIEPLMDEIRRHELSILITHPGYVDGELLDLSTYSIIRARDLQLVTSQTFIAALKKEGVELITYSASSLGRSVFPDHTQNHKSARR